MKYLKSLCLLLCFALLLPLAGCSTLRSFKLVDKGEARFAFVLPENAPAQVLYARDKLLYFVQSKLGVTPVEDASACKYRVLLGNTGEKKSTKLAETLGENEYALCVDGKDLVVVAKSDAFLYDAIAALLQSDKLRLDSEGGSLTLSGSTELRAAGDLTSVRYLFTQGSTLTSKSAHYTTMENPEGLGSEQGGCFDGTYYYQAFLKKHSASDEDQNIVKIAKYDYKTKTPVACSEELALNHCNDITYNPKTGELLVANNNPNRRRVSVLSAETLQLLRTVEIDAMIYGITYDSGRDRFAVALSSSQNMRILNADLSLADDKVFLGTELTKSYTTQGICSDDTFIYHVLWDGERKSKPTFQNVITVYDWYGNFVGVINIGIGIIEPENISIDENGKFMIVASTKSGAALYEIELTGLAG